MSSHNRANDNHMWGRNISIAAKSFSTYFGLTWCRSTQRSGGSGCASTKRLSNCCVAREKYQKFPSVQTIGLSCSIASMEWRKTVSTSASKSRKTSGVAEETSCRYLHESHNNSNQTKIDTVTITIQSQPQIQGLTEAKNTTWSNTLNIKKTK